MTDTTETPGVAPALSLTAEEQARLVWLRNLQLTTMSGKFWEELYALVKKHVAKTNTERQAMVAAQIVGTLLPLIDPKKKMTEYEANALIRANIARGRQRTMERIAKVTNL